jgi:hypothetical protein
MRAAQTLRRAEHCVIHCVEMSFPAAIPAGEYVPTADDRMHVLSAGRYHTAERSALLPGLDLGPLCTFLDRRRATEAMRDFRNALRTGP